jgi:hypothetical protein
VYPSDLNDDARTLTPRTAAVLGAALQALAAAIRRDVEQLGDRPLVLGEHGRVAALDRFPRVCWTQDARSRHRFADSAERLAEELADGRLTPPRSRAEGLCLHLAVEDAADAVDDVRLTDAVRSLPRDRNDYDWDSLDEFLFADHDVLDLSGDRLDSPVPQSWFTPVDQA